MTFTELNDNIGSLISCRINGTKIPVGRIQYENGIFYICQNHRSGDRAIDRMSFRYSWSIGGGKNPESYGVSDIKLIAGEWDSKDNIDLRS